MNAKYLAILLILVLILIQGAYCIQVTYSGGDFGESGSVSTKIDVADNAAVNSKTVIDGATITPMASISGPVALFEQNHSVKDATGKYAKVYVKVVNAPNGLTYSSNVLPSEGTVGTQSSVSAEQWLTVSKADSIKCTASASYKTMSEDVGLEEAKGTASGDYVTLTGYYGKAYASATSVYATQTATDGSGKSIKLYGHANDGNGLFSVDTTLNGISGGKASFVGLDSTSSSGTTQVTQKEHIHGGFTGTATYTPTTGTATSKTRSSNYGTEYDLSMKAIKGSSPTGIVGYYVSPSMATTSLGAIQGAVNAAQSGDTVNLYGGTYKENVQIDKSLAINGAGSGKTIVDGHQAGSVFTIGKTDPRVNVALSAMTIKGGSGTSLKDAAGNSVLCGGGILNYGKLTVTGSTISGNTAGTIFVNSATGSGSFGGGICNLGTLTVIGSIVSGNNAAYGGGIYSNGILNVQGASTITGNNASRGGGIYNYGSATVTSSTISANNCLPQQFFTDPYGNQIKYIGRGGGIYNDARGTLVVTGSTISGNTALEQGGGICNDGTATVTGGTTISGNKAKGYSYSDQYGTVHYSGYGGGIFNGGYYSGSTFIPGTMIAQGASTISSNTADYGGGIGNLGTATITGCTISGNTANKGGGGVFSSGYSSSAGTFTPGTLNVVDSTISGNKAYNGGGIDNYGKLSIGGTSQIINNQATSGYGGGIYSTTNTVTLDGTKVAVKSNKAHLPSPSELKWYQGWGIYLVSGTPTTTNSFSPTTQVTGNTHI